MIAWYVDNKTLSYIYEDVSTRIIEMMAEHFSELAVLRGETHKLLGIDILF